MEPFERIRRFLATVRRRLDATSRGEALCAVVILLCLTGIVALGTANVVGLGPGRWAWLWVAAGIAAIVVAVRRLWWRPRQVRKRDEVLALWVEERVGGFQSSLITSVETEGLLKGASDDLGFSPQLARESAVQTADRIGALRPAALDDRARLKRLGLGALGSVAVAALVAGLAPGFFTLGAERLVAAPVGAEPGDEALVDLALGQLTIEVHSPGYVGVKPRHLPKSAGDIQVLRGSEVRFAGAILMPAERASLILESDPAARWPLDLVDGVVRGAFKVGESDRYQFALTDARGVILRERTWRSVDARPDLPPDVQLLLPEADLEVKPTDEVAFFFEATDDIGLGRVELVINDDAGEELERSVVTRPEGERMARGDETVPVARLGLDPGDAVVIYFEAFDRNDLDGPGVSKSAARRISLYSPEAEHERLLARLEQLIDRMIDVLADRLESPIEARDARRLRTYVELQQGVSVQTGRIIEDLGQLLGALSTDTLASDDMRAGMQTVLTRLQDVYEQERAHLEKAVLRRATSDAAVMAQLLAGANDEGIIETEFAVLTLKELLDQSRKDSILDAGRELLETQQEIMDLLQKLKDTKDPAALEAALKELAKLQKKLRDLQRELAKLAERTPYENQNAAQRPSENQENIQDLDSKMEQIQKLLAEGKIDEAMKLLEEMQRDTQQLMAALQDDFDSGDGMSATARRKANEFNQQLSELTDGQRGLKSETDRLQDAVDKRLAEELREKQRQAMQDAEADAKALRETLAEVDEKALHPDDAAELQALEEGAEALEKAIQQGKLSEATGQAEAIAKGAESLAKEVGESEARTDDEARQGELRDGMGKLGEGEEKATSLAERLKALTPKPGQGMSEGERAEMERLGKRQGELGERLQQLGESLKELDKEIPGMEQTLKDPLQKAQQKMGEAQQQLGERQGRQAEANQQQALEQLEQAQQSMEQQMQQSQQKKQNPNGKDETTGVNDPRAKVEIPEEDPYAKPQSFREEVLKAMKERAPEAYKDAIEKFYEELVK